MSLDQVEKVANAILYEGYILYPYRPALKNAQRWTFGGLFPRIFCEAHAAGEAWYMQTECLCLADESTRLDVKVRFLHLMNRTVGKLQQPISIWPEQEEPDYEPLDSIQFGQQRYQSWQEAVERSVVCEQQSVARLLSMPYHKKFHFPGSRKREPLTSDSGEIVAILIREQQTIEGQVNVSATRISDELVKLRLQIINLTAVENSSEMNRDAGLMQSLVSTHSLLQLQDGHFLSSTDPPEQWSKSAEQCNNQGSWPVLAGEEGSSDCMLAAPIILYDYPQVAEESPGDLFDCTEIDEILTLRVMTLTDAEKQEAISVDERIKGLLQRTESLARDQMLGLHGTMREFPSLPERS